MTAILPLVHFTSFLVSAALIAFLLFKNSRGSLNRLCILLILADALWSFGYCFVHLSQSAQSAMFWINFSALGWGSFSIAGIYFYLALTHKDRVLKNKPLLTLLVLLTVFFIYQQWTGQMVAGVVEKPWGWAGVWSTSIYSFAFYGYFGIISLLNTGLAIHYYFQAKTPREKHVARLLSITAVTSLLLGSITDVILPLTGRTVLPQMADILGMIWEIGIFLSVTRYGLMSLTPVTASERILSTMTDALMLLDTHRIVKLANRAAVDVFETTESELIGTEFDSHVLEKVLVKSFLGDVSLSGKSATKEFTYLSRSGGQIQVQLSASNIIDNTKTASGFVVVARDITELKLAVVNLEQKNLKILESEDYQKKLLSSLMTGVVTIDAQTHQIVEVNSYASRLIGARREEIIGQVCHNFICSAEKGKCPITDLQQDIDFAERKLIKSDRSKSAIIKSVFKMKRGSKEYLIETITDIEPLKQAQVSLQESEQRFKSLYEQEKKECIELEEEAKARVNFINVLAHELRTPLTPIMVSVEMLQDLISPVPDSIQFKLIHNTMSSAELLKNRLEELLDLARCTRGVFELKPQTIETSEFLRLVAERYKPALVHKQQQLVIQIPAGLPQIEADPSRLEQVVLNLLSNAGKYSPPNTAIMYKASLKDYQIQIEVKDQGIGIEPEDQKSLFLPYHRAEQDRQSYPGIGLGLAVAKQIIEAHGGKIWVESQRGHGCTFKFTLPVKIGAAPLVNDQSANPTAVSEEAVVNYEV